ncbi:hypothetical protein [Bradyrhizobium sp. CCBAU 51753]|uniref:hypothetical protein n=1 Tax=Bradyrhizobium sp. CCBAU 51753 TaxID=1325100 RepID=UPI00188C77E7|nr:hypothetical protein [Bradyrhizobium sp. CCBAU 51753]QOZ23799.1 hypothetical protein XH93_09350 [Bradyrhizobium sp. CCBAU 51753]
MSNEDRVASAASQASSNEHDTVVVYGQAVVDHMTYVSSSYTSLLMCMGQTVKDAEAVLVPFVEIKFDGPRNEEGEASGALFSAAMPLENIAFVLEDVSSDLIAVLTHLTAVSSGRAKLEPRRIAATKQYLSDTKQNLEKCLAELDAMGRT